MDERTREYYEGFRRGPWGMADAEYWMNDADFARAHAKWKLKRRLRRFWQKVVLVFNLGITYRDGADQIGPG